ncbi:hypothetical protein DFP91_5895 [Pseudorhodoplanes sinuspersici]|nr:hypothetical protein DFP91_5895 [Pseudorhodoplanes sinuspersici]
MTKPSQSEILKVIDRLVCEGHLEHTMIDGKPGVRVARPTADSRNITSGDHK